MTSVPAYVSVAEWEVDQEVSLTHEAIVSFPASVGNRKRLSR